MMNTLTLSSEKLNILSSRVYQYKILFVSFFSLALALFLQFILSLLSLLLFSSVDNRTTFNTSISVSSVLCRGELNFSLLVYDLCLWAYHTNHFYYRIWTSAHVDLIVQKLASVIRYAVIVILHLATWKYFECRWFCFLWLPRLHCFPYWWLLNFKYFMFLNRYTSVWVLQ